MILLAVMDHEGTAQRKSKKLKRRVYHSKVGYNSMHMFMVHVLHAILIAYV